MPSPTSRRILRAVSLTGLLAIVSLGHAEAPNPVSPNGSRPPKRIPSPAPTLAPSSTPLLGQIQLQGPKEPIRVEGEIKPVDAKPVEIKPVQIQLPNQDLRVTAAGIPEKIKVEWETKPMTLDVRWPKEPVRVAFDSKAESGSKQKEITERIDKLERERNNDKKQISDLNEKLASQRDSYRDGIERTLRSSGLGEDKTRQLMREIEIQRIEWWGKPHWIFLWMILSGALGGFLGGIVNTIEGYGSSSIDSNWVADIILGIVAALMVPGVLYFWPGKGLQAAAQNAYLLISLCSICFVVAMVGELFIAAVLQRLRRSLRDWAEG